MFNGCSSPTYRVCSGHPDKVNFPKLQGSKSKTGQCWVCQASILKSQLADDGSSIAGITINISNAKLRPLSIDGGFEIVTQVSDSVGVLYPGERVDLEVQWNQDVDDTGSQISIQLDPE